MSAAGALRAIAALACVCAVEACSTPGDRAASQTPAAAVTPASTGLHAVFGRVPAAQGSAAAIVVLEPREPREFPPQAQPPVMDQVSETFLPEVLIVRTGQPVQFRNNDDVLHNVNVKDDGTHDQAFNVAIPTGATYGFTFTREGFYNVRCDIHPAMAAEVVATSTPYTMVADAEGKFEFEDVAPGSYAVTIYIGARKLAQAIEVSGDRTEVRLPPE